MIRTLQTSFISLAFLSANVFAHDDLKTAKPKPRPEAEKDAKAGKSEDH